MLKCPDARQDGEFQKLVAKLNGDSFAAYRVWAKHEKSSPGEGSRIALEKFDSSKTTVSSKQNLLLDNSKSVTLDEVSHTYMADGNVIDAVGRRLDMYPETKYHGPTSKEGYADSGTDVHEAYKIYFNTGNEETLLKHINDKKLPANLAKEVKEFKEKLSKRGTILSEKSLFTSGLPEGKGIGGTPDVILLTDEGKIEVYDFKTTNITSQTRKTGKNAWSPLDNGAYKANRYTAQMYSYGRMIEWTLGQPVSDYFLVPIVIENNIDDTPESGIKSLQFLGDHNVNEYGRQELANDIVDRIFSEKSAPAPIDKIKGIDESSNIYGKLTGDITGTNRSPEELARTVRRKTQGSTKGYIYGPKGQFVPFLNQTDLTAQQNQIINEFVNKNSALNNDLSYSVKNYLTTGDTAHLKMLGERSGKLHNVLRNFVNRTGLKITNLKDIGGFEEKKNWITIEEGNNIHLLYIGSENLNSKFSTSTFGNESLFGKHIGSIDSTLKVNSSLKNTLGDARKLEGTFIAMKLKQAKPSVRFGITAVFGVGSSNGYSDVIDLSETLKTVEAMNGHETLRTEMLTPDAIEMITSSKATDYNEYRQDFRESLNQLFTERLGQNSISFEKGRMIQMMNSPSMDAMQRQALKDTLQGYLNNKLEMGKEVSSDYETYLLSAYYLQLQDMDISITPISIVSNMASVPQNLRNPLLQKLNKQLNTSITVMNNIFWKEYKTGYEEEVSKYLKSKGFGAELSDRLLGDTPRHYVPLMKTITRDVVTKDGKKQVTIPTMEFVDEDSAEFNKLSSAEQQFIRKTNDVIQKYAEGAGMPWQRGKLPLVRATTANKFFNAQRTGGRAAVSELVNNSLIDLEADFGTGEQQGSKSSNNIFWSQTSDETLDKRMALMGLDMDGIVRMDEYSNWTTNVEVMVDMFAIQALKVNNFNNVGVSLRAANSVYQWYKSNLIGERINTNIDFVNWFHEFNVNTRDVDTGTTANKFTRALSRVTSIGLIGGNVTSAVVSQIGNEMTLFSESIGNWLSDNGHFTIGNMTKAKAIVGSAVATKVSKFNQANYDKIELLLREFRLFNNDLSSTLNGYHRKGDKFLFKSKNLFALMNAADWQSRSSYMVAQLLQEGSWDAYSIVDGKLVYDEFKDQRFNGKGKYTNDQIQAMKQMLRDQQGLAPDANLQSGHDVNMGTSMKAQVDYLLGGFDRETRSGMNARWWGKMFIAMKNWLPAKLDRWRLGRFESEVIGEYIFEYDDNGKMVPVWKGEQMEGILMSWLAGIKYIQDKAAGKTSELTKVQKNNIIRSLSDFVIVGLTILAYHEFPDDDDKTQWDDTTVSLLRRGVDDLLTPFNFMTADKFVWTPVPLSYLNQSLTRFFKAVTEADPEELIKIPAVSKQVNAFMESIDTEE